MIRALLLALVLSPTLAQAAPGGEDWHDPKRMPLRSIDDEIAELSAERDRWDLRTPAGVAIIGGGVFLLGGVTWFVVHQTRCTKLGDRDCIDSGTRNVRVGAAVAAACGLVASAGALIFFGYRFRQRAPYEDRILELRQEIERREEAGQLALQLSPDARGATLGYRLRF